MAKVKLLSSAPRTITSTKPGVVLRHTTFETRPASGDQDKLFRDALPAKQLHHGKARHEPFPCPPASYTILNANTGYASAGGPDPKSWRGDKLGPCACARPGPAPEASRYGPGLVSAGHYDRLRMK